MIQDSNPYDVLSDTPPNPMPHAEKDATTNGDMSAPITNGETPHSKVLSVRLPFLTFLSLELLRWKSPASSPQNEQTPTEWLPHQSNMYIEHPS